MGNRENITRYKFPKQGKTLHKRVKVCFHYNTDEVIGGFCVRDDTEEPFDMIFRLDDGRFVRAVECQYSNDT